MEKKVTKRKTLCLRMSFSSVSNKQRIFLSDLVALVYQASLTDQADIV